MQKHLLFLLFLTLTISPLWADKKLDNQAPTHPDFVIGTVNSKPLYADDLQDKEIYDLRKKLHEALLNKFQYKVLEELAKKNPIYKPDQGTPVTPDEIKKFYIDNKLQARGLLKDVSPLIKNYLESIRYQASVEKKFRLAVRRGIVKNFLKEPGEFLVQVNVDQAYLRGNRKARVMLLEFSDYQCPYCSKVQKVIERLREEYGKKVVFGYRHFPLSFHQEADEAAIGAECAREQKKFPQYHALLYANQKNQQVDDLIRYAKKAGVSNMKQFTACLKREKYRSQVDRDITVASSIGIKGTPAFVIGLYDRQKGIVQGQVFSGALPESEFRKTLNQYLTRAK